MEGIQDADLILHAGDWTSLDVYEQLREIAPVIGVFGNVDPPEVKDVFEEKESSKLEGFVSVSPTAISGKRKRHPNAHGRLSNRKNWTPLCSDTPISLTRK